MGSSKRNLLTSILLLVVMGVFAVLTIFIVVDAINKKYYNDIKVEYEVQEESPNIILTFARNEGSNFGTDDTKVVLSEDNKKFRIDGTVPTIESGVVTNLDDLTSSDGREFYFFSTNSSFIDPQEDPENPDFIFSETDSRYYVSTEDNPIWYDVPKSSENLTLYSVFLTPNVHNSDFANAPLNTITNAIVSHDVVDLPANAFEGSYSRPSALTTVLLPDTLQSIGDEAFYYCSSLTSITIPEGVTSIGSSAFSGCSSLTFITIPESITSIGSSAFDDCSSLEIVDFGENSQLTSIGNSAFRGCRSLNSITIPDSVTSIGRYAFNDCSSLTSITIPSSVTSIEDGAFSGCSNIQKLYIDNLASYLNISYEIDSSPLFDTNQAVSLYVGVELITNLEIPDGVTVIPDSAFRGINVTSVTIPSLVTSIERYAFYNCSSLTSITIPEGVTSIGDYAFSGCSSLTSITIPDSVTSIGRSAFYNCSSLKTVNLEDNSQLTSIEVSTFESCSNLTSITIPNSVTSIEDSAFYNCSSLTSITIPSGVTSIRSNAFKYCFKLVEVYDLTGSEGLQITKGSAGNGYVGSYADYVYTDKDTDLVQKAVEDYTFYYYNNIMYLLSYTGSEKELNLPSIDKVKEKFKDFSGDTYEIREYAFYENTNITSVVIPNCVTSIGERAFYNCSSLKTVTFKDNSQLTSIGDEAFRSCRSLTSITIPNSVTSIGNSAFSSCRALTSITIPDSVTSIGYAAFENCSSLTSITIPDSVTSIGWYAFSFCSNLTIYCEASSRPSGWNSDWNYLGGDVYWAGEWEMVDGVPVPIE